MKINREAFEGLADLEHGRWTSWMEYLFTKGQKNPDGSFTIDASSVVHWERQMRTTYADMTEREKDMDRIEVKKNLFLMGIKEV